MVTEKQKPETSLTKAMKCTNEVKVRWQVTG